MCIYIIIYVVCACTCSVEVQEGSVLSRHKLKDAVVSSQKCCLRILLVHSNPHLLADSFDEYLSLFAGGDSFSDIVLPTLQAESRQVEHDHWRQDHKQIIMHVYGSFVPKASPIFTFCCACCIPCIIVDANGGYKRRRAWNEAMFLVCPCCCRSQP